MESMEKQVAQVSAVIGKAKYQTTVTSGKHSVLVDEPEHLEGADTGMNPFGLLLASLGSCTVITLRMYVDRKMWVVEEIKADLEIHAIDGGNLIKIRLHFKGELTAEQIKRLHQIADACPIHKLLTGNIQIDTTVSTQA